MQLIPNQGSKNLLHGGKKIGKRNNEVKEHALDRKSWSVWSEPVTSYSTEVKDACHSTFVTFIRFLYVLLHFD